MTLPSQFSLEEENFYKDIQDLVKNGSQNEKELSLFLQRYMDLLSRADLDDETFIINFTKAGLIIEASAKVYGTKVDRLWVNLEHVLESLKNKNQGQSRKKLNCDDGDDLDVDDDEGKRKLPHSRRKKKMGDALFSVDDFLEIDNISGLSEKNMNECNNNKESKLKLCQKTPTMFIKNKKKKKKIDVCLNKCTDDKDVIRLRDWVTSSNCQLIKEIYISRSEIPIFGNDILDKENIGSCNEESIDFEGNEMFERSEVEAMQESLKRNENFENEKNNNTEMAIDLKEASASEELARSEDKNDFINDINLSRESDVAKFPNVLGRLSEECLVDVDEVFWNSKCKDVIPNRKLRAKKTNKPFCLLCAEKKVHKKQGKRCLIQRKLGSLDSYFAPHIQPTMTEPQFGIYPDEELYSVFKTETKLIEQLGKVNAFRNINEAYHPDECLEKLRNFLGFDGFEESLMKKTRELQEHEMSEENLSLEDMKDDNENYAEDPPPDNQFELPLPATQNAIRTSITNGENDPGPKDNEQFCNSDSEYQKLVIEELKDHYAAKTSFAKNKELGQKISKWHEMIADKIKLSQKRGALNMNLLAKKIMNAFPPPDGSARPTLAFKDLVKGHSRRDVPRYFFACLQMTNEGNIDIFRANPQPLATDCMILMQLRAVRANYELDESSVKTPSKDVKVSKTLEATSKKRNFLSRSPPILESKSLRKNKKLKQKIVTSYKRPKNFSSVCNSKRRRCSISSTDSFLSV